MGGPVFPLRAAHPGEAPPTTPIAPMSFCHAPERGKVEGIDYKEAE